MAYGSTLKLCRIQAGLTQEELGEKLHLTRSAISKYELDKSEISLELIINWLKVTNRRDLAIPIGNGVNAETINNKMFSDDYFNSEEYRKNINFVKVMDRISGLDDLNDIFKVVNEPYKSS